MNEQYLDKNQLFIRRVKRNLRSFLKTVNYSVDEYGSFASKKHSMRDLCEKLELKAVKEHNAYILKKPDNKLKKILSDESDSIDPYFINEICELFGFPVEKIYQISSELTPEEAAEIMAEISENNKLFSKKFAPLSPISHRSYFGEFYGYTVDHNPNSDGDIIDFTLTISSDENNTPRAEYVFFNKCNEKQLFTGIPYYIHDLKTIYIEMTANNDSRFLYLYFNGIPYKAEKFSYKSGVCVRTSTASKKYEPDVKSFVLTGNKLSADVRDKVIPGLLKMCHNSFYVLLSDLNKSISEDGELKKFYDKYKSDITVIDNALCLVKEQKIIDGTNSEKISERIFVFESLAKIKKYALAPDRVIYREAEADYNYFYNLAHPRFLS